VDWVGGVHVSVVLGNNQQISRALASSDVWLAVAGLLAVHLLAFVAILRSYPQWRMIWFMPVVVLEAGLFSVIVNMLLGNRAN